MGRRPQHLLNDTGGIGHDGSCRRVGDRRTQRRHRPRFSLNGEVRGVVLTSLLLLLLYASAKSDQLGRLYSISWKIVLVVGLSAAVFVGANLLISQGRRNWARYRALAGGLLGAAGFGLLRGNRSVSTLVADSEFIFTRDEGEPFVAVDPAQIDAISKVAELRSGLAEYATGGFASLGTFEWPLVGLVLGLVAGYNRSHQPNHPSRRADRHRRLRRLAHRQPACCSAIDPTRRSSKSCSLRSWAPPSLRESPCSSGNATCSSNALFGAAIGATIGGWLLPDLGSGSGSTAIIAAAIPLALLGLRFGWPSRPRRQWARLVRPAVPCGDLPRPCAHLPIDQPGGAGGPHHPHLLPRPRQ